MDSRDILVKFAKILRNIGIMIVLLGVGAIYRIFFDAAPLPIKLLLLGILIIALSQIIIIEIEDKRRFK